MTDVSTYEPSASSTTMHEPLQNVISYIWPPVLSAGHTTTLNVAVHKLSSATLHVVLSGVDGTVLLDITSGTVTSSTQLAVRVVVEPLLEAGNMLFIKLLGPPGSGHRPCEVPLICLPLEAAQEVCNLFDSMVKMHIGAQRVASQRVEGAMSSQNQSLAVGIVYNSFILPLLRDLEHMLNPEVPYHLLRAAVERLAPLFHAHGLKHCMAVMRGWLALHEDVSFDAIFKRINQAPHSRHQTPALVQLLPPGAAYPSHSLDSPSTSTPQESATAAIPYTTQRIRDAELTSTSRPEPTPSVDAWADSQTPPNAASGGHLDAGLGDLDPQDLDGAPHPHQFLWPPAGDLSAQSDTELLTQLLFAASHQQDEEARKTSSSSSMVLPQHSYPMPNSSEDFILTSFVPEQGQLGRDDPLLMAVDPSFPASAPLSNQYTEDDRVSIVSSIFATSRDSVLSYRIERSPSGRAIAFADDAPALGPPQPPFSPSPSLLTPMLRSVPSAPTTNTESMRSSGVAVDTTLTLRMLLLGFDPPALERAFLHYWASRNYSMDVSALLMTLCVMGLIPMMLVGQLSVWATAACMLLQGLPMVAGVAAMLLTKDYSSHREALALVSRLGDSLVVWALLASSSLPHAIETSLQLLYVRCVMIILKSTYRPVLLRNLMIVLTIEVVSLTWLAVRLGAPAHDAKLHAALLWVLGATATTLTDANHRHSFLRRRAQGAYSAWGSPESDSSGFGLTAVAAMGARLRRRLGLRRRSVSSTNHDRHDNGSLTEGVSSPFPSPFPALSTPGKLPQTNTMSAAGSGEAVLGGEREGGLQAEAAEGTDRLACLLAVVTGFLPEGQEDAYLQWLESSAWLADSAAALTAALVAVCSNHPLLTWLSLAHMLLRLVLLRLFCGRPLLRERVAVAPVGLPLAFALVAGRIHLHRQIRPVGAGLKVALMVMWGVLVPATQHVRFMTSAGSSLTSWLAVVCAGYFQVLGCSQQARDEIMYTASVTLLLSLMVAWAMDYGYRAVFTQHRLSGRCWKG